MYIALTFDDGYKEQLYIARYLARHGIKATFFIITGLKYYIGKELLEPSEVREIYRLGHEIGSHTVTHINMINVDRDTMHRELVESKKTLEDIINDTVHSFAYPFGPHSDEAAAIARSIYQVVRGVYLGSAKYYTLFDEHGCILAFNLRLSNIYEILRMRRFDSIALFTHMPSLAKLGLLLRALSILKPKYVTLRELADIISIAK